MGGRLGGCTTTYVSKKGCEKVLGRVLGKGSWEGVLLWVYNLKGVLRRVLRRGFWKEVPRSQKVPRMPPWRVRLVRCAP